MATQAPVNPVDKAINRMKERQHIVDEFCGPRCAIMTVKQFDFMLRTICLLFPNNLESMAFSLALNSKGETYIVLSAWTDKGLEQLVVSDAVADERQNGEQWADAKESFCANVAAEVRRRMLEPQPGDP